MREILFRGKAKDSGEWVEGDLVRLNDGGKVSWYIYGKAEVDPETVGQFIGLTDRNGKRIFEGDVIKHYNRVSLGDFKSFDTGVIFWDEKKCMLRRSSAVQSHDEDVECFVNEDSPQVWKETARYYEVIGNIHDNPELAEVAR